LESSQMSAITELRLALQAAGFEPVPVVGKEALLPNWNSPHSLEEIASWEVRFPQWPSTGGLARYMPTLDADILYQDAAEAVEDLVRARYEDRGEILVRIGRPPKRCIPFRTAHPFPKMRVEFLAPNKQPHKIEFLADGQQVVLDGVHPETRKPYSWHAGRKPGVVALADLPEIDESEARALLDAIAVMLEKDFGFTRVHGSNGHGNASPFIARTETVDVDAALASIHYGNIHDTWKDCMGSMLRHGVPADEILTRLLKACESNPACHADPRRLKWRTKLVVMLTWFCQTEPEFVLRLPDPVQGDWHATLKSGKRPGLAWRYDTGLHVRGYSSPGADSPPEMPRRERRKEDQKEQKKYRFPLIAFDELRPGTEQSYLIDELFPTAGLALVYGAPKSGKSFWTFDAMMHVTLGWEYRDRSVQQGPAVYCAFEGAHGYHKRGEAFRRHHCLTDERPPMFVIPGRADLIKDHAALITDMGGQLADRGVTARPKAVVLDTLNKSLIGSESKDVDMANYIAAAEAIQKAFGGLVIIVHHHGIEESRPRGHTSLRGAIDVMIRIDRDERNNIIALVEEMRDGPEGAQIASHLVAVMVGEDVKGKPLTSAAVEPTDAPAASQPRAKLTPNQRTMLTLLGEAGVGGLHVDEWNEKAKQAGLANHRRATLVDLRDALRHKGLVAERQGRWFVIKGRGPDL
jgi:hypothetical protein